MRKFRKPLSIVLALMLALSMFSMCATASAAEIDGELKTGNTPETHNGTINVTSNIGSPVSVNYDYYNDAVTVTYKLQSTHKIVNTQSTTSRIRASIILRPSTSSAPVTQPLI